MNESEVMPLPRWDRWFEIHDLKHTEARAKGHIDWLAKQEPGKPIYMRPKDVIAYPQIRAGVPYPLDQIVAKYPRLPGVDLMPYFTNTVVWQIALAIELGFRTIWVSGIDMAADTEYNAQRPSVEYMVGYARGLGIEVGFPVESDLLLNSILYGFEDEIGTAMVAKMNGREQEYSAKVAEAERTLNQLDVEWRSKRDQMMAQHERYLGAREAMQYFKRFFTASDYITMKTLTGEQPGK